MSKQNTSFTRTSSRSEPWKYFNDPPFGCHDNLPSIRGRLLAVRGPMALVELVTGKEILVHREHWNEGCK